MSSSVRARNGAYAALNGLYWMLCCLAYSFSGVFLLGRGYTNSQLGMIVAAGYVLGLVLQPVAAAAADRTPRASVGVIGAVTGAVCLSALGLWLLPGKGPAVTGACVAFLTLVILLQPLVNAFAFYLERLGAAVPFGLCRAVGSVAYGLLAAVLGRLVLRTGENAVPAAGVMAAAAMLGLMAWFARLAVPSAESAPQREEQGPTGQILKNRRFLAVLAATALLFFAHAILSSFTIQIVRRVGGDSGDMGLLTGYIAVLELPAMLLFERLYRRFSAGGMLRFASVFFAVKTALVFAARSMGGLYGAMSFQALSYALFIPASVRCAGELSGSGEINKAQACITAMITVGNICASAAGGVLIDRAGVPWALGAAAVSAAAGAAVMVLGLRRAGAGRG